MGRIRKPKTVSQVMRTSAAQRASLDWDATVREAFLEGCLRQGVRAELATEALGETRDAATERALRTVVVDAAGRAASSWLTIENCLEQYGELAALALERCIEEASLQIRSDSRSDTITSIRPRTSGLVLRRRDESALSIVKRGRERLAQFWGGGFCAA
jgi:hypothetical protein